MHTATIAVRGTRYAVYTIAAVELERGKDITRYAVLIYAVRGIARDATSSKVCII